MGPMARAKPQPAWLNSLSDLAWAGFRDRAGHWEGLYGGVSMVFPHHVCFLTPSVIPWLRSMPLSGFFPCLEMALSDRALGETVKDGSYESLDAFWLPSFCFSAGFGSSVFSKGRSVCSAQRSHNQASHVACESDPTQSQVTRMAETLGKVIVLRDLLSDNAKLVLLRAISFAFGWLSLCGVLFAYYWFHRMRRSFRHE
jgi:hypothetical protein